MVSVIANLEPMCYEKDPVKYMDSLCERIGYSIVNQMSHKIKDRLKNRINEMLKNRYFERFLKCDIINLRTRVKISVPIFRVDYEYIKLADAEDIFG